MYFGKPRIGFSASLWTFLIVFRIQIGEILQACTDLAAYLAVTLIWTWDPHGAIVWSQRWLKSNSIGLDRSPELLSMIFTSVSGEFHRVTHPSEMFQEHWEHSRSSGTPTSKKVRTSYTPKAILAVCRFWYAKFKVSNIAQICGNGKVLSRWLPKSWISLELHPRVGPPEHVVTGFTS